MEKESTLQMPEAPRARTREKEEPAEPSNEGA